MISKLLPHSHFSDRLSGLPRSNAYEARIGIAFHRYGHMPHRRGEPCFRFSGTIWFLDSFHLKAKVSAGLTGSPRLQRGSYKRQADANKKP